MVATDVASRGIGMIYATPLHIPSPSPFVIPIMLSCGLRWCSALRTSGSMSTQRFFNPGFSCLWFWFSVPKGTLVSERSMSCYARSVSRTARVERRNGHSLTCQVPRPPRTPKELGNIQSSHQPGWESIAYLGEYSENPDMPALHAMATWELFADSFAMRSLLTCSMKTSVTSLMF